MGGILHPSISLGSLLGRIGGIRSGTALPPRWAPQCRSLGRSRTSQQRRSTLRRTYSTTEERSMKRVLRVGVLAFSLVGLLGFYAQPASATEVIEITFVGNADIGTDYAAFGFPVGDPSKTTLPGTQVKTEHGITTVNYTGFHNSSTLRFTELACTAEKVTTGKNKHTEGAGTCDIDSSGFIHGYCGLSTATLSGTIHLTLNSPVVTTSQLYSFHLKVTTTGPDVTMTGSIHNHTSGQSGSIVGEAVSGLLTGGTCTTKAPKTAPIAGEASAVLM